MDSYNSPFYGLDDNTEEFEESFEMSTDDNEESSFTQSSLNNDEEEEDDEDDDEEDDDELEQTNPNDDDDEEDDDENDNDDDNQNEDHFEYNKRRRLNSLGGFQNANGVKYMMPSKVIRCKQSKRIRALAYNPKRNEIAAISMNAAFHYFDVNRFEQVSNKKKNTKQNINAIFLGILVESLIRGKYKLGLVV